MERRWEAARPYPAWLGSACAAPGVCLGAGGVGASPALGGPKGREGWVGLWGQEHLPSRGAVCPGADSRER